MNTMRNFPFVVWISVCLLLLSACGGPSSPTGVSLPGQRPSATRPAQLTQAPGKVQVITEDPAKKAQSLLTATPPASTRQVTAGLTSPASKYDAAKVISTFGSQALGIAVSVPRSTGLTGEIILPQSAKGAVNAAAALAGEVAAGTVTSDKGLSGVAQIALGKGKVSGDMNLDISSASLGAISLLSKAQPPTTSPQALALIRQTFPALGSLNLLDAGSSGSQYVFETTFNKQGLDWKSRQTTMIAARVVAGVGKIGPDLVVWALVANGELAAVK